MLEFGGRVFDFLFINEATNIITFVCVVISMIGSMLSSAIENIKWAGFINALTGIPLTLWMLIVVVASW